LQIELAALTIVLISAYPSLLKAEASKSGTFELLEIDPGDFQAGQTRFLQLQGRKPGCYQFLETVKALLPKTRRAPSAAKKPAPPEPEQPASSRATL
jgi:hypothetical protein